MICVGRRTRNLLQLVGKDESSKNKICRYIDI